MPRFRNDVTKIVFEEAIRIADLSAFAFAQAREINLIEPFPAVSGLVSFTDLCLLYAFGRFVAGGVHISSSGELSGPDMAARLALPPMLAFAGELGTARYGLPGPWIRTTHPNHVPERYVIHSADAVCRVGTLSAYETVRREQAKPGATIFIFDTKVAGEHLVDAIGGPPYQVTAED